MLQRVAVMEYARRDRLSGRATLCVERVLQHVAAFVCCSMLQRVAVIEYERRDGLSGKATLCVERVLQHVAACCSVLQ